MKKKKMFLRKIIWHKEIHYAILTNFFVDRFIEVKSDDFYHFLFNLESYHFYDILIILLFFTC